MAYRDVEFDDSALAKATASAPPSTKSRYNLAANGFRSWLLARCNKLLREFYGSKGQACPRKPSLFFNVFRNAA
jgi:hypothetical protein